MRRSRGFTLTEVVAVAVVTAALAVSVAPALSGVASQRQMAAGRQVQRDLAWARQRAMSLGRTHWVVFTASSHSYSVLAEDASSPGRTGAVTVTDPATRGPMAVRLNMQPYDGVQMTGVSFDGGSEVGFDRLGTPRVTSGAPLAANGTVTLSGGQVVTIQARSGLAVWTHP